MKNHHNIKGFALITTLAAIALCMLLLSAFLTSNRSFFNLSRMDEDRQVCRAMVMSLAEHCRQRLEEDKTWGYGDWQGEERVDLSPSRVLYEFHYVPAGEEFEGHGLVGQRHIWGNSPQSGVEFHIAFSNNLNSDSGVSDDTTDPLSTETGVDDVPAKSCLLRISARKGGHREAAEITLRRAALFDSVLAASGDVEISLNDRNGQAKGDARLAIFDSKDPVRNAIRSESNINLPHRDNLRFRRNDRDVPINGTVWAKKKIYIDGDNSGKVLGKTAQKHNIELLEKARDHYNVPGLTADVFDHTDKDELELTPSHYLFAERELTYKVEFNGQVYDKTRTVRVLQRNEPNPDGTTGPMTEFHYHKKNLLDPINLGGVQADPSQVSLNLDSVKLSPSSKFTPQEESIAGTGHKKSSFRVDLREDGLKSGGKPKGNIHVDLRETVASDGSLADRTEPKMVLPSNYQLRVKDGSFKVVAPTDRLVPKISFSKLSGNAHGATEIESHRGHLSVDGNIMLEGRLEKGGKIISREGSVVLLPHEADVESSKDFELAVFAKQDVSIVPPKNLESNDTNESAKLPLVFRGLVYAGNDFIFDSARRNEDGTPLKNENGETVFFNRQLFVEGAIIAHKGEIDIHSRRGVHFVYNPDYLDDYIEKDFSFRNSHVEEIAWKPL